MLRFSVRVYPIWQRVTGQDDELRALTTELMEAELEELRSGNKDDLEAKRKMIELLRLEAESERKRYMNRAKEEEKEEVGGSKFLVPFLDKRAAEKTK